MDEIQKFSISQIIQYLTCPRSYYFLYLLNFRLKKSDSLFYGSAIHMALESYLKNGDPVKTFTDYITADSWQKPKDFQEEKYLEDGIKLLELYKKRGPYLEPLPDWIERRETINLKHPVTDEIIPIPFTFKIDVIVKRDDGLYVLDFKTSSSDNVNQLPQNRLQGISYCLAYYSIFGKMPKGFIQTTLVKRKKNPQIIPTIFRYSLDDMDYCFNIIKYVIDHIQKRMYLTDPVILKTFYSCPIGPLCNIHSK